MLALLLTAGHRDPHECGRLLDRVMDENRYMVQKWNEFVAA